jgi:hypothetical protein
MRVDGTWPACINHVMLASITQPNKLDVSGGSVFRNLLGAAEGALIRAAASTQTLCCFQE